MTDTAPRVITIPAKPELTDGSANKRQLRVAAYCRVSTDDEEQLTSYEAQQHYYTDKIMTNPEWTMAGIFADAADIIGLNQNPTQKGADLVLIFHFSARFEVITARIIT